MRKFYIAGDKLKVGVLFFLTFFGIALPVLSQQPDTLSPASQSDPVKIGLALSGGGAKGFAHIGILKVLEKEGVPVHMVTGTSIGAVIGSLYAIGYTPEEIRSIALRTNWIKLFDDNYQFNPHNFSSSVSGKDTYLFTFPLRDNRLQLPVSITNGQNVSMMLYRLMLPFHDVTDFTNLPLPFACVATNLATGEPHLFRQGYLAEAVRASFAIPSFFKPVHIDGQSYIDGSISRNIPAEDVREMGADIVIASDVGEPVKPVDSLHTFVHILRQAVGYRQQESDRRQLEEADYTIQPDVKQFSSFSYDKVNELIRRGEEAARRAIPAIKRQINADTIAPPSQKSLSISKNKTLFITEIVFNNIEEKLSRQAYSTLDISPPSRIPLSDLERKVKLLYSSGLFSHVSYRLRDHPGRNGKTLVMSFQPKVQEYAGFSMRYDSKYKAALLFGVSLTGNVVRNDRLDGRLRVGEVLEMTADYSVPVTLAPLSRFHVGLGVQRSPIDFYVEGDPLSTIGLEQTVLSSSLAFNPSSELQIQSGLEAEFYNLNEAVGNTLVLENTHFLMNGFGELTYHTLNRPYFPTRGQKINVRAVVSSTLWGSTGNFFQLSGNWLGTVKLWPGVNFTNRFTAGYTSASSLPLHYHFYLGGLTSNPVFPLHQFSFAGYDGQQLRSTNLLAYRSQLQFRLGDSIYATGSWNIAHLSDQWTFNIKESRLWQGFSISAGALTIIGPAELSLSAPRLHGGYMVRVNIGYHF